MRTNSNAGTIMVGEEPIRVEEVGAGLEVSGVNPPRHPHNSTRAMSQKCNNQWIGVPRFDSSAIDWLILVCYPRRMKMDELGIELAVMSETAKLMAVLEGFCLECGADLKLTEVSGTQDFLLFHPKREDVTRTEWEPQPDGFGDIGCVSYTCAECGQKFEVYKGCGGDWTLGC